MNLGRLIFHKIIRKFVSQSQSNIINDMAVKYVWMDLEMTGLEVEKDTILEIGCILTTPNLDVIHSGYTVVVHQPDEVLQSMNSWCNKTFAKNGLTELSRRSQMSLEKVDNQLKEYIEKHSTKNDTLHLAGNTIYMDRLFITKYMPLTAKLFHYRQIDVSSIKILAKNWFPEQKLPHKQLNHRTLDDILESIEELKFYRMNIFRK